MARILLFNKPFGVLSQFTDRGSPTVRSTLSDFIAIKGVYPAGRLDRDSEGLILLTDDGGLQARIADPRYKMAKCYLVQVEGDITEASLDALRRGVRSPATRRCQHGQLRSRFGSAWLVWWARSYLHLGHQRLDFA